MKEIPTFESEEEEQKFWSDHDSTEYVDWSQARRGVFPNLTEVAGQQEGCAVRVACQSVPVRADLFGPQDTRQRSKVDRSSNIAVTRGVFKRVALS